MSTSQKRIASGAPYLGIINQAGKGYARVESSSSSLFTPWGVKDHDDDDDDDYTQMTNMIPVARVFFQFGDGSSTIPICPIHNIT